MDNITIRDKEYTFYLNSGLTGKSDNEYGYVEIDFYLSNGLNIDIGEIEFVYSGKNKTVPFQNIWKEVESEIPRGYLEMPTLINDIKSKMIASLKVYVSEQWGKEGKILN